MFEVGTRIWSIRGKRGNLSIRISVDWNGTKMEYKAKTLG
jgi:hypothetical protein